MKEVYPNVQVRKKSLPCSRLCVCVCCVSIQSSYTFLYYCLLLNWYTWDSPNMCVKNNSGYSFLICSMFWINHVFFYISDMGNMVVAQFFSSSLLLSYYFIYNEEIRVYVEDLLLCVCYRNGENGSELFYIFYKDKSGLKKNGETLCCCV